MAAAIAAALAVSVLVLPAAVSAQSSGAYLDGAEPWTESDCAGEVPIVVGSDAKAQSDIYSAVTLAGVLDTDCVVLAGPRDGDMPADQRARLDAAADEGGYVLGGTAAIPNSKVAGRDMTRLGGATRWETSRLIGSRARALAENGEPGATGALDMTLTAPSDVRQPGVFLEGAEPWIASDCAGEVPIVVGSDAKAQSDIYSAVTLAGVVGTDCVVLAGPRDGDMPAHQQTRLAAAESGGYVLGGTAAVPTAKVAGRDMTRLGGATRWETAQLVGRRASGDSTTGTSTSTGSTDTADGTKFIAVASSLRHSCALRGDGTVVCWGDGAKGELNSPTGSFAALTDNCGLRNDGTVECWGVGTLGQLDVPPGTFTSVSSSPQHSCGLRSNDTVDCWGWNQFRQLDAPSGTFTAVSAGHGHSCGLRVDGMVVCWGLNDVGQSNTPSGSFIAVSAGGVSSCAIRRDGTVECWGSEHTGVLDVPPGIFTAISVGGSAACGLRGDETMVCWGRNHMGSVGARIRIVADAPSGSFTAVSVSLFHACALRGDGTVVCWGNNDHGQMDVPRAAERN